MRGLFITGTDTGVGKTRVATALLHALTHTGLRAVGMKPVAAGFTTGGSVNADVLALDEAGNVDAAPADRNPYAFAEPVAPHLAAQAAGICIELPVIDAAARRLMACTDTLIVEGAGGVLVPLGAGYDMLDIAAMLELPLVLVVGMRLGCLNHALLSALAIRRRAVELRAWVANVLPPAMPRLAGNIDALAAALGMPPIVSVDAGEAPHFDVASLARLGLVAAAPGATV